MIRVRTKLVKRCNVLVFIDTNTTLPRKKRKEFLRDNSSLVFADPGNKRYYASLKAMRSILSKKKPLLMIQFEKALQQAGNAEHQCDMFETALALLRYHFVSQDEQLEYSKEAVDLLRNIAKQNLWVLLPIVNCKVASRELLNAVDSHFENALAVELANDDSQAATVNQLAPLADKIPVGTYATYTSRKECFFPCYLCSTPQKHLRQCWECECWACSKCSFWCTRCPKNELKYNICEKCNSTDNFLWKTSEKIWCCVDCW